MGPGQDQWPQGLGMMLCKKRLLGTYVGNEGVKNERIESMLAMGSASEEELGLSTRITNNYTYIIWAFFAMFMG